MDIRDATDADGRHMAVLINMAGDGIPEHLWAGMATDGLTPLDVGAMRAARQEGDFSHANTRIAYDGDNVLGMAVSYRLDDPYETGDLNEYPDVVRPLIELEAAAAGTWYINAIATYAEYRGRGIASTLLAECEERARAAGCSAMSLIVADENPGARQLYVRLGYDVVDTRPFVDFPGSPHGGNWELMVKQLDRA